MPVTIAATTGTIEIIVSTTPRARICVAETSKHAIWRRTYASANQPGTTQAKSLEGRKSGACHRKKVVAPAPTRAARMLHHSSMWAALAPAARLTSWGRLPVARGNYSGGFPPKPEQVPVGSDRCIMRGLVRTCTSFAPRGKLQRHARTHGEKHLRRGNARCGPARTRVARDGIFDAEPTKPAIPPANARPNTQNAEPCLSEIRIPLDRSPQTLLSIRTNARQARRLARSGIASR